MNSFEYWERRFSQNDLLDFSQTEEGLLWLKLRSIKRKDLMSAFCVVLGMDYESNAIECIWEKINSDEGVKEKLYLFIKECQKQENEKIDMAFEVIRNNLYKMTQFHWGGGFRNSLDKAIVARFVKTDEIIPFEDLDKICEGPLLEMSRGYLLSSWYNYWSSVLIENQFRRIANVMPAFGRIKNVDFFVKDFPFDLKVTYIPREYAKLVREELKIEDPLKQLKHCAREQDISFDNSGDYEQMQYVLTERLSDNASSKSNQVLKNIKEEWVRTVEYITSNKRHLIRWLYENQGGMRFGSENRIFLVLVDKRNPNDAWKLKRNIDLVKPAISEWIDKFDRANVNSLLVSFDYERRSYQAFADIIFACKDIV